MSEAAGVPGFLALNSNLSRQPIPTNSPGLRTDASAAKRIPPGRNCSTVPALNTLPVPIFPGHRAKAGEDRRAERCAAPNTRPYCARRFRKYY